MWDKLETFCQSPNKSDLEDLIDSFAAKDESFASAFINRRCSDDALKAFARAHIDETKQKYKQEDIKNLKNAYSIWTEGLLKGSNSQHPLYGSAVASTTSPEESGRVATSPVVPVTDNSREEIKELKNQVQDLQTQISSVEEAKLAIEAELANCQSERQELNQINSLQTEQLTAGKEQISSLTQQVNEKNAEIAALRQQLNDSAGKIDLLSSDDSKDEELANLRQQLAEKTVEFSVLEQRLADKEKQIAVSEQQTVMLKDEINWLTQQIAVTEQQIVTLKVEINRLTVALSEKDSDINALEHNVAGKEQTIAELRQQLDAEKEKIASLTQQIADLQKRLSDKDDEVSALKQNIAGKEQTIAELKQQLDVKEQTISSLTQNVAGKEQTIAELRQQLDAKEQTISGLMLNIADLEAAKRQLEEELVMYKAILPAEIFSLVGICFENHADASLKTLLFSFLLVTSHSPIEDESFLVRFNTFDKELFRLFKNDPEKLTSLRTHIQEFLNARLENHKINWDLIGNVYDEELHRTDDSIGQTVLAVESALITGKTCQRAKVRTSNE